MKYRNSRFILTVLSLLFTFTLLSQNSYSQSSEECLICHSDPELEMEKNGKTIPLFVDEAKFNKSVHSRIACISCHKGFDPESIPHKENIEMPQCMDCHQDAPVKHNFHPQMLKARFPGSKPGTSCVECHGVHDVLPIRDPQSKWTGKSLLQSCGSCHQEEKNEYTGSKHDIAFEQGLRGSPSCLTCHKSPLGKISSDTDKQHLKLTQEKLCLSCHLDDPEIRNKTAPSAGFINAYEHSVHGRELIGGNGDAANCIDCHNSHNIRNGNDPQSSVFKTNIPQTCSQCHSQITKEYNESIHGISIRKGNMDSPVCTDCHGEHNILKHTDPESPVAFQNVSTQVCSPCHSSVRLSDKYGLAANRYQTFKDTYHGLALIGGSAEVANCASCHGVHNIKPSSDPTSTIHKNNLVKTCGKCHPGANENFAKGKIHVSIEKEEEPILYFIATTYLILIFTIVGGMFLHNLLDFIKKTKIRKLKQLGKIPVEHHGHGIYLRMTLNERIQHITMAGSFIILVITGFMLRFPETWWVSHIRDLSSGVFEIRSLLHRIAAVAMISVSLYHIYYIAATKRGRQLLKDLLPKMKDLTDAWGIAKYNLGFARSKPKLDRFSYVEKAEYWSLVWGTIVMSLTGFVMWFDNTFIGLFTKLGYDIARTIHYYEAWLAFLAIVVWHFYFVIFNPDVYPMSLAWIKGVISEEEMAEEHALELERIKLAELEKQKKQENTDIKESEDEK